MTDSNASSHTAGLRSERKRLLDAQNTKTRRRGASLSRGTILNERPKAFDSDECARILALFEEAKEADRRDAMGISRRNRCLLRDKWNQ